MSSCRSKAKRPRCETKAPHRRGFGIFGKPVGVAFGKDPLKVRQPVQESLPQRSKGRRTRAVHQLHGAQG